MHPSKRIQAVLDYIEDHVEDNLDSDGLAAYCLFSKSHFFKLFTIYTGYTPMQYVLRRKLHYASKRVLSSNKLQEAAPCAASDGENNR
jgi:AraC family transcriptional regulator